jgi:hypothetical protein
VTPAYDDRLFAPPAPIARVVVRHPEREESLGDVPMLIDSGADATLPPSSAARSLGLEGTGRRYQLIGFDGTVSESEAVLASVAFLRWSFRGRYLLTDADVGVLGRDILNMK